MTYDPNYPPGPLGTFSQGKINDVDEGDLAMAIAADRANKIIRIDFGKPVEWIGLDRDTALGLIGVLRAALKEIE